MKITKTLKKSLKSIVHSTMETTDDIAKYLKKKGIDDETAKKIMETELELKHKAVSKLQGLGLNRKQTKKMMDSAVQVTEHIDAGSGVEASAVISKAKKTLKKSINKNKKSGKKSGTRVQKIIDQKKGTIKTDGDIAFNSSEGVDTPVTNQMVNNTIEIQNRARNSKKNMLEYRGVDTTGVDDSTLDNLVKTYEDIYPKNIKFNYVDKSADVLEIKLNKLYSVARGSKASPMARAGLKEVNTIISRSQAVESVVSEMKTKLETAMKTIIDTNKDNFTTVEMEKKIGDYILGIIPGDDVVNSSLAKKLGLEDHKEELIEITNVLNARDGIDKGMREGNMQVVEQIAESGHYPKDWYLEQDSSTRWLYQIDETTKSAINEDILTKSEGKITVPEETGAKFYADYMTNNPEMRVFSDSEHQMNDLSTINTNRHRIVTQKLEEVRANLKDPKLIDAIDDIKSHYKNAFSLDIDRGTVGTALDKATKNTFVRGLASLKVGAALSGLKNIIFNGVQPLVTGGMETKSAFKSSGALVTGYGVGAMNWARAVSGLDSIKIHNKAKYIDGLNALPYIRENKALSYDDFMEVISKGKYNDAVYQSARHHYYSVVNPDLLGKSTIEQQRVFGFGDESISDLGKWWLSATDSVGSINAVSIAVSDIAAREWALKYGTTLVLDTFQKNSSKLVSDLAKAKMNPVDVANAHKKYIQKMYVALNMSAFPLMNQETIISHITQSINAKGQVNAKMLAGLASEYSDNFIRENLFIYAKESRPGIIDEIKNTPILNYGTMFKTWSLYAKRPYAKASKRVRGTVLTMPQLEAIKPDYDELIETLGKKGWTESDVGSFLSSTERKQEVAETLEEIGINADLIERITGDNLESFVKYGAERFLRKETWKNVRRMLIGGGIATLGAGYAEKYLENLLTKTTKVGHDKIDANYGFYIAKRFPLLNMGIAMYDFFAGDGGIDGSLMLEDLLIFRGTVDAYIDNKNGFSAMWNKLQHNFWRTAEGRAILNHMWRVETAKSLGDNVKGVGAPQKKSTYKNGRQKLINK